MAATSRNRPSNPMRSGPALVPAGELSGKPAIPLSRPIIVAGSRESCRIHLISRSVSKAHTLIVVTRHTVFVRDLCSREGTFVNGERLTEERDLGDGDILKIGRFEFIFSTGGSHLRPQREAAPPPAVVADVAGAVPPVPLERRVVLLGRKQEADVRFVESNASAAHAVIVSWEGKRYIRDLGSRTGTFVNGKQVHQQELRPLDQLRIGDSDLVYEPSTEGPAGVEVVDSPTESAVARALPAQELLPVESSSDDTLALGDAPDVLEPENRDIVPHPAAGSEPELPMLEPDDGLSRRGWHRANGDAPPEADVPGAESVPAEPAMSALPGESAARPQTIDDALDLLEILNQPLPATGSTAPAGVAPAATIPIELEAEAAAEAALTTADSMVAAVVSVDDLHTPAPTPPGQSLPLADPEVEAEKPPIAVEVIAATEPLPDSAQPLEEIGADEAESTLATINTASLAPPVVSESLSDTAFTREVAALTEPTVGEPVIVEPAPEPPPRQRADVIELALSPQPVPTPPADVEVVDVPRDLDLRAEPPPIPTDLEFGPPPTAPARRASVEPSLPLTAPDPAELAEDPAHAELPLAPLPAVGVGPIRADVADPIDLPAVAEPEPPAEVDPAPTVDVAAVEPEVEPVEPPIVEPVEFATPGDSRIATAIVTPDAPVGAVPHVELPPDPVVVDELAEEAAGEASFTGELVESGAVSEETAFAVVVPPPELDLPPARSGESPVVADVPDEVPALEDPPTAPQAASNVAHDLGPAPLADASAPSIAIPAAAAPEAMISVPPPLPPDAPTVTDATDDETPAFAPTPTPRRPRVIRDGFNRRSGRAMPEVPEVSIGGSPFAGSRGQAPVDPFSAPSSPDAGDPVEAAPDAVTTPMDLVQPETDPVLPPARRGRPAVQPTPTFAAGATPINPPAAQPVTEESTQIVAALAPRGVERDDLHDERRRRLRRIPTFAALSLLLIMLASAGIWYLVPVHSTFETALKFQNFGALTMAERQLLQNTQLQKIRNDLFRRATARTLANTRPSVPPGFLASPVEYDRAIQQADWPDVRPGELVLRYRGSDPEDRYRLHAIVATLFGENQDKVDDARRIRSAVKELTDSVESNTRKLADLKQQIERERMLGESRPTPAQLSELEATVASLEKGWNESLAKLKNAEAEQQRLEQALVAAQTNPPPPPDSDAELIKLEKELSDLKARYEAAQSGQSAQSASAREELDAAMDSFSRQLEAARGLGENSPELTNYIAAAENLQKTTRELIDEFIDRQTKQSARLNELKAKFDERSRQRITEMREGDPQLRDMRDQREVLRRQVNAATGSDGQVTRDEIDAMQERLRLLESAITAREEVLNNDPVYAEAIASLQTIIDQTEQDLVADRKKADEKLEDLQRQFAVSSPAVSGLPEEQKKVARQLQEQLSAIGSARRRYADALDSDRMGAEQAMKDLQARIVVLQGDVDARRKMLTQDYTTKSLAAVTAALEAHAKVLTEARDSESVARASFEQKNKALRTARDALAMGSSSDDRLNRLITDRTETERILQMYNDQLQNKLREEKRLLDIIPPTEAEVFETPGKDPRSLYILIAVGIVLAGFGAATWWTIHAVHRLDEAFLPQAPEAAQKPRTAHANGADEHEHATAL